MPLPPEVDCECPSGHGWKYGHIWVLMINIITLAISLAILFTQTAPMCSSSSTINREITGLGTAALDESLPPEQRMRAHFSHLSSSKDHELKLATTPIVKNLESEGR